VNLLLSASLYSSSFDSEEFSGDSSVASRVSLTVSGVSSVDSSFASVIPLITSSDSIVSSGASSDNSS
jgi:hypothetical protein